MILMKITTILSFSRSYQHFSARETAESIRLNELNADRSIGPI